MGYQAGQNLPWEEQRAAVLFACLVCELVLSKALILLGAQKILAPVFGGLVTWPNITTECQ
jgi:hypothetical protein